MSVRTITTPAGTVTVHEPDAWVYLVVAERSQFSFEAKIFSDLKRATDFAIVSAEKLANHPDNIKREELTPWMRNNGFILSIYYSLMNRVFVLRRLVDDPAV
jgi:hypothetical protein